VGLFPVGRTAEGERDVRRPLDTRRATLGPDHPDVAISLVVLAALERTRRELPAAAGKSREPASLGMNRCGAANPQTAQAQVGLAEVLIYRGNAGEAESLLNAAMPVL